MILSVDIGLSTGYAMLRNDGSVVQTGVLNPTQIDRLVELQKRHNALVIAELPLLIGLGQLKRNLEDVKGHVERLFPDARFCYASEWKSTRWAKEKFERGRLTQHERDAIMMGRFYIDQLNREQRS